MSAPAPNRFCSREHDEYLAAVTLHLLREREERYPGAITNGHLTAAEAASKLELMREIAHQWAWIADPAAPLCPAEDDEGRLFGHHNYEFAVELAGAAAFARAFAAKNPASEWHQTFALLVEALAWWQHDEHGRPGASRIVQQVAFCRDVTHAFRAQQRQRLAA